MIMESIANCDEAIRPKLFANIILSGGNTKFPGFDDRLEAELRMRAPDSAEIRILKTIMETRCLKGNLAPPGTSRDGSSHYG